jgi:hypothetical protein
MNIFALPGSRPSPRLWRGMRLSVAFLATTAASLLASAPAKAWWSGGIGFGFAPAPYYYNYAPPPPVVVVPPPPPAYAAPPAYYSAPPPVAAPRPPSVLYGSTCFAGVYVCPLPRQQPVGSDCSCPGLGAPSYGTVR